MVEGKAIVEWGQFWQGEMEFAAEQVGYFMEDLVMESRKVDEEDDFDMDNLTDSEEGSGKITLT